MANILNEVFRLALQPLKLSQLSYSTQRRWASTQDSFPVIRVPVAVAEKLKRENRKRRRQERELSLEKSRREACNFMQKKRI